MGENKESKIKYIQLCKWIESLIYNGQLKYDDKLPSENMLCMKFNISRQTVRNALQSLEQDGMIRRVQGSGTFVAVDVASNQSGERTVGLIMSYMGDYIFPTVFSGIQNVLFANNISLQIAVTKNNVYTERVCLQRMLDSHLSGLIVEGSKSSFPTPNVDYYHELKKKKIPIIFFHNYYENVPGPRVLMDDYSSGYLLTQKLIENGHRNIAGIFKFDDYQGKERYRGFLECQFDHNIPFQDEQVKWFSTEDFDRSVADFERKLGHFLKRVSNCTAIVAYNDNVAIRLLDVIESRGMHVPDDISLVSFDDTELSKRSSLKIVDAIHPKVALGEKVATNMINMICYRDWEQNNYSYQFEAGISDGNSIRSIIQSGRQAEMTKDPEKEKACPETLEK